MIPVIPWYITLTVLAGGVILMLAVRQLFVQAASRSGLSREAQGPILLGVGLYLVLWFGLVILTSPSLASLATADPYQLTLVIPTFAVAGPLGFVLALWRFPALRTFVAEFSLPGLIGVQTFRVLGATFLVLLAQGQLPARFAHPAGWGDIAVGLAAPVVALLVARGVRWPAVVWSLVGITDLFVAVGMGTGLATPLLPGVTSQLPAAAAMGAYPMILVPAFAVPIALTLHIVTFRGLLKSDARVAEAAYAR